MLHNLFMQELQLQYVTGLNGSGHSTTKAVKDEETMLRCLDKKDSFRHLHTIPSCRSQLTRRQQFVA